MSHVMNTPAPVETVRAGVNDKKLLSTMKHLYSNSFSMIGELMQNARRAGASQIKFDFDPKACTLIVEDDGAGIQDFNVLVQLCDSNWSEQTTLSDSPFGMGAFSLLYQAESVTYISLGKALALKLDDVVNRRTMEVRPANDSQAVGTRIELRGLSSSALGESFRVPTTWLEQHGDGAKWNLVHAIARRALGFPLRVFIGDAECARPHAQSALAGEMTSVGFVSLMGLHRPNTSSRRDMDGVLGTIGGLLRPALYLQGLPIRSDRDAEIANHVVHLDGSAFVARMPDREELYDAKPAGDRIHAALQRVVRSFLAQQKERLAGREFVARHWSDCIGHKAQDLLNDVPWIPISILERVAGVASQSDDVYSSLAATDVAGDQISREEIVNGVRRIWRDTPDSSTDGHDSALILKVMQRAGIVGLRPGLLDSTHWIFQCTPSAQDLTFEVVVVEPGAPASLGQYGEFNVTGRLAEAALVHVTSSADAAFSMELRIEDDWIIVPADHATSGIPKELILGEVETVYYEIGNGGADEFHPVDAVCSFLDSNDSFQDEWRERAMGDWDATMSSLRGNSLATVVNNNIHRTGVEPLEVQAGQFAILRSVKKQAGYRLDAVDPEREGFWDEVARRLENEDTAGSLAQRLKQAFTLAIKPGEVINP